MTCMCHTQDIKQIIPGDIQKSFEPRENLIQDEDRERDDRSIAEQGCEGRGECLSRAFQQALRYEIGLKRSGLSGRGEFIADGVKDIEPHLRLAHHLVVYNPRFKFE